MKKILLCLLMLFLLDNSVAQAHSDAECFLQLNGDTVCYDKKTGRKYILKRV